MPKSDTYPKPVYEKRTRAFLCTLEEEGEVDIIGTNLSRDVMKEETL